MLGLRTGLKVKYVIGVASHRIIISVIHGDVLGTVDPVTYGPFLRPPCREMSRVRTFSIWQSCIGYQPTLRINTTSNIQ
jgi:hypothetical protein